MLRSRFKLIVLSAAFATALMLAGCTKYYAIAAPSTGRTYYTTSYKHKSGSLVFEDKATRSNVTIQNGEITRISKDEYRREVK